METSFCAPSLFYFIISLVSLFMQYKFTTVITFGITFHLIFIIIWTILLYFLCIQNLGNIAWFLVVLPFIIGYFMLQILLEKARTDPSILLQFGTPNPKTIPTTPGFTK